MTQHFLQGRTEREVVCVLCHQPHFGGAGHVEDVAELCVLFGHPQPHIGAARHDLRVWMRGPGGEQAGQGGGRNIREIGLLRRCRLCKQL